MAKIYIVDDEFTIRDMCYDLFTDDGHDVVTIPNGVQLLKMLQESRPDLVLMDINIPGEEGLSLLRRMPNQSGKRIPVIIFSGVVTPEIEKEAFRYGAVDVIPKGGDIQSFFGRVEKVLRGGSLPDLSREVNHHGEKVLIVDDDVNSVNFLKDVIEQRGFSVQTATSGEEAVEKVRAGSPKMILLDVAMPGMDGILTLKKIREIDPHVGVVMASGVDDEAVAKEAMSLGAYAYVLKPFDVEYLEMVVLTRLILST